MFPAQWYSKSSDRPKVMSAPQWPCATIKIKAEQVTRNGSVDPAEHAIQQGALVGIGLTPIEDFIESEPRSMLLGSTVKIQDSAENYHHLLTIEVLAHARVYSFAHIYLL